MMTRELSYGTASDFAWESFLVALERDDCARMKEAEAALSRIADQKHRDATPINP